MKNTLKIILLALVSISSWDLFASEAGKVIVAVKQVELVQPNNKVKAKRGTQFSQQDKIVTGHQARAQLRFVDGSITTLGADSEFVIHKYQATGKTPSARLELVKGAFRTITGTITKTDNPDYTVKTPVGSIGIRGTDFWGGYLQPDAVDILFIDGEHEILVSNEFGEVLLTKPGQGTTIKKGEAPTKAKVWPKEKVARAVATISLEK